MRPSLIATAICLFSLLCGCASADEMKFSAGSGDLGTFVLKTATDFGGHPISNDTKAPIGTAWKYSVDQYGVVILSPPKSCASLESFLKESFGVPGYGPVETNGFRLV